MRYSERPHTWVPGRDGGSVEIVTRPPTIWVEQRYTTVQARVNETMPLIAHRQYRTADAWWAIADMNPRIPCPDDVRPGSMLNVPVVG